MSEHYRYCGEKHIYCRLARANRLCSILTCVLDADKNKKKNISDLLAKAEAAEARAEKAERERDVATNRMKDIISGNIYPCEVCKHRWKCALFKPQRKCDYFEYGKKEE